MTEFNEKEVSWEALAGKNDAPNIFLKISDARFQVDYVTATTVHILGNDDTEKTAILFKSLVELLNGVFVEATPVHPNGLVSDLTSMVLPVKLGNDTTVVNMNDESDGISDVTPWEVLHPNGAWDWIGDNELQSLIDSYGYKQLFTTDELDTLKKEARNTGYKEGFFDGIREVARELEDYGNSYYVEKIKFTFKGAFRDE